MLFYRHLGGERIKPLHSFSYVGHTRRERGLSSPVEVFLKAKRASSSRERDVCGRVWMIAPGKGTDQKHGAIDSVPALVDGLNPQGI